MGGKGSKAEEVQNLNKINSQKWEISRKEGNIDIAVDETGRQAQINVIKLDPVRKIEDEQEIYYYRTIHEGPLVKCYGAETLHAKSTGVCGVENTIKVITQRIIKRWRELPQLAFPQILYALSQALEGYRTLYKQAGIFQTSEQMLGINGVGDLKVWLNENFANNNPSHEKRVLYTTANNEQLFGVGTESEMVDNVLKVIEEKCEQGRFPQDFTDQLSTKKSSFADALNAVQQYITSRNIAIPNKIHPDSRLMYVSRKRGLPSVSPVRNYEGGVKESYIYQLNQNSSNIKPIEIAKYDYSNSPGYAFKKSQTEKQKPLELAANQQQTYSFSDNQNSPSLNTNARYQTGGYYTGTPEGKNKYQWDNTKYGELRQNPLIQQTQSVYESKKKTFNSPSEIKNGKHINLSPGIKSNPFTNTNTNTYTSGYIPPVATISYAGTPLVNAPPTIITSQSQKSKANVSFKYSSSSHAAFVLDSNKESSGRVNLSGGSLRSPANQTTINTYPKYTTGSASYTTNITTNNYKLITNSTNAATNNATSYSPAPDKKQQNKSNMITSQVTKFP